MDSTLLPQFLYLVGWFEAGVGYLVDGKLFVVSFLSWDDRRVGDQGEVDPGVGYQVSLKFIQT